MARLVLYRAIASPCARAVLMLGDILQLPLECREVNLLKGEHKSQEYKKINPMGTVPVLQDGDFILSESHAIMKYLLASYGGEHRERLYPSEHKERALVDQALFFNAGFLFPRMGFLLVLPRHCTLIAGAPQPPPEKLAILDEAYAAVDAYLQRCRFIAADHLTLGLLAVGSTATATLLLKELDRDRYPRFADWIQELEELPIFKNINAEGLTYLKKFWYRALEMQKLKQQS
ncbi:glutathione S-transferase 1-like [Ostrinia nubilalis]|uniref:glutathione S-transferase 1-like n=1 Tax=Ostrinia nubilalis TaxID=29057 RepID=UPI00308248B8